MKRRRPGMTQVRAMLDHAESRIKRAAITAGWSVRIAASRRGRSRYMRLTHPERGRLMVRISDHPPIYPYRYCLHALVGYPSGIATVTRWLRSNDTCRPRRSGE